MKEITDERLRSRNLGAQTRAIKRVMSATSFVLPQQRGFADGPKAQKRNIRNASRISV